MTITCLWYSRRREDNNIQGGLPYVSHTVSQVSEDTFCSVTCPGHTLSLCPRNRPLRLHRGGGCPARALSRQLLTCLGFSLGESMRKFQKENPVSYHHGCERQNTKSPLQKPGGIWKGDTSWPCLIFLGSEASEPTWLCGSKSLLWRQRPCVVNAFIDAP